MTGRDKGNLEKIGEGAGALAGKAADTAVDWMSSMIRGVAGNLGGWWSDRSPAEATRNFGAREDSACRSHFDRASKRQSTTQSYDAVRPLYQFGHLAGSNPDYQGRSFEEVENDLRTSWQGEGDWDSVRDYVATGYSLRDNR